VINKDYDGGKIDPRGSLSLSTQRIVSSSAKQSMECIGIVKKTGMTTSDDSFVQIVSNDGKSVFVERDIVENVDLLEMLFRSYGRQPCFNINLSENDILMVRAIALIQLYPSPYDTMLIPEEYESAKSLGDYVGIKGINPELNVDWDGDYTTDFLRLMGHMIEDQSYDYDEKDAVDCLYDNYNCLDENSNCLYGLLYEDQFDDDEIEIPFLYEEDYDF